jgi:hypothetical protein
MSIKAMNEAWAKEVAKNPHTAYNSWCRGFEAALAQPEQSQSMDEWRSMVVVNLLRRCPNLSKHELRELAAHFQSRLPTAQPEPVAYADALDLAKDCNWDTFICKHSSENHEGTRFKIPLYTSPPSKPWVGLTDDEINKIVDLNTSDDGGFDIWCDGIAVARIVCAKLKEKNA